MRTGSNMKRIGRTLILVLVMLLAVQGTALAASTGKLKITTKDIHTGEALKSVKLDVVLTRKTKTGTSYELVQTITTGTKGTKKISLKPGNYELYINKVPSGYAAESPVVKVTVKAGKTASSTVNVYPRFTCKIIVKNEKTGKPIVNATVEAFNGDVHVKAKTNSKGVATLKNVMYGKNKIYVKKYVENSVDVSYNTSISLKAGASKSISKTVTVPSKNIKSLKPKATSTPKPTATPAPSPLDADECDVNQDPIDPNEPPSPLEDEYTYSIITETVSIPFNTVYIDAPSWPAGEEAISQEGQNGQKEITYDVKMDKDGNEISRTVKSERIIRNPVDKEIYRGTFVPSVSYTKVSVPNLPECDPGKRDSALDAECAAWAMKMAKDNKVHHSDYSGAESVGGWGSIDQVVYGRNYSVISTQNGQLYSGNVSLGSHGGAGLRSSAKWGAGCVARTETQPDGSSVTVYYACARGDW